MLHKWEVPGWEITCCVASAGSSLTRQAKSTSFVSLWLAASRRFWATKSKAQIVWLIFKGHPKKASPTYRSIHIHPAAAALRSCQRQEIWRSVLCKWVGRQTVSEAFRLGRSESPRICVHRFCIYVCILSICINICKYIYTFIDFYS